MAQNAENKVALVTGANKGIGYEVARQLAAAGATVLLGARDAEIGKAAAHALKKEGARVRFVSIDLTRLPTIKAAAESIGGEYGKLDILVKAGVLEGRAKVLDLKDRMRYRAAVRGAGRSRVDQMDQVSP